MRAALLAFFGVAMLMLAAELTVSATISQDPEQALQNDYSDVGRHRRRAIGATAVLLAGIRTAYRIVRFALTAETFDEPEFLEVSCKIIVENYSNVQLWDPGYVMESGTMVSMPVTVGPGKKEIMQAERTSLAFYGTEGTVAWMIGDTGIRLVVLWSVPFQRATYENCMAIGVYEGWNQGGDLWYDSMYEHEVNNRYGIHSRKACPTSADQPLHFEYENLRMTATMGLGSHPTITVKFMP